MARIIGAIIALALVIAAIRLAIVALIVAGLIFRTQATIGLLIFSGLFVLLSAYPAAGVAALGIAAVAVIINTTRRGHDPNALIEDPVQD